MNRRLFTPLPASSRRAGGRAARRMERAAPLSAELRPIRPGMTGGQYRPLDDAAVRAIDQAVYQILEEIGLSQAPESGVAYMTAAGAIAGDDGRIRFPRALVDDMLVRAARDITLFGQDPKHDMLLSGSRVHFGTAGAAVHVVDVEANCYRESYLADIYDAARIVENMDNIHFFQRPMVARDIVDPAALDLNTVYAAVKGTTKHVGTSFTEAPYVAPAVSMLHDIAGGEDKWRARP
ncbi:MAG: trimethylamine methyltransferase family protein, partial [Candidatus Puniceispirillaceae bacterium]